MASHLPSLSRSVRGFTLVEALVAILVLSLGLLGVAAMQLKAMQSTQVSYQRTIATVAAQDAIERLWSELIYDTSSKSYICPEVSSIISGWTAQWEGYFSGFADSKIEEVPEGSCQFLIEMKWADSRFLLNSGAQENVSRLQYFTMLPGE